MFSFISCKKDSAHVPVAQDPPAPEEFFNYTIDATNYSYTAPADTVKNIVVGGENSPFFNANIRIGCNGQDANYTDLTFSRSGIGLNSQQPLAHFGTTSVFGNSNILLGTSSVNITEYGAVGEFIAGNFTGSLFESQNQSVSHNITCSFRVRRAE